MKAQLRCENIISKGSEFVGQAGSPSMKASEVWVLLGISKRTFYRLLSRGDMLEPVRLGARTVWWRDEVLAWRNAGCPSPRKWQQAWRAKRQNAA